MSVISTDQWLLASWNDPLEMCESLTDYFPEATAADIYQHLVMHGMYQLPLPGEEKMIEKLVAGNVWKTAKEEEKKLRRLWDGPDIPIFIFPADQHNRELKENFNGKSGVAFQDQLFLFISPNNEAEEIKALLTHEYNHVCRLAKFKKAAKDYRLLDTIILEGLAEHAVSELLGEACNAGWTKAYSDQELSRYWERLVLPAAEYPKSHPRHEEILYGRGFYPYMIGYAAGYYTVKKFAKEHALSSRELLPAASEVIAGLEE